MVPKPDTEKRKSHALAILVIAVLTCLFYSPQLVSDRPLLSTNLYEYLPWRHFASEQELQRPVNSMLSDPLAQYLPLYYFVKTCVDRSILPIWIPNLLCGYPLVAVGLVGLFYPLNWIYMALDPVSALTFSAVIRIFLAGLFMLHYLRFIGLSQRGALFGAICFMFNGFFIVWNDFPNFMESAIWLPLMFLFVEKFLRDRRPKFILLMALSISMSILAGMFQIALYNIYATGLYALWRGVSERKRLGMGMRKMCLFLSGFGASVAIALVLCSAQILPFHELTTHSHRRGGDLQEEFIPLVNPPETLVQYVMPEFFGSHTEGDFWFLGMAKYLNEDLHRVGAFIFNLNELNGYTGTIVLFLALIGLSAKRKSLVWFFVILVVITRAPIFSKTFLSLFYSVIPGFKTSSLGRLSFTYMYSVISLAALGFDRITGPTMEGGPSNNYRWVSKTCIYAVALCAIFLIAEGYLRHFDKVDLNYAFEALVNNKHFPRRLVGYYVAIVAASYHWAHTVRTILIFVASVVSFGLVFSLFRKRKMGANAFTLIIIGLTMVELLHFHFRCHPVQKRDPYFTTGSIEFLQKNLGHNRIARVGEKTMLILPYNTGVVFGLKDAQGQLPFFIDNISDFLRLLDKDAVFHERWAPPIGNPKALDSQLLDLLGVKYVLTERNTDLARDKLRLVYDDGIRIYENIDVFPRAFFVAEHVVMPSKAAALKALSDPDLDLRRVVVLEEHPQKTSSRSALHLPSTVEIEQELANEIEIVAEVSSDGFLILSDTFYPGWKAYVDGAEHGIYRADYAFRAVPLTPGRHKVRFVYKPSSLRIGAALSGFSLITVISVLAISSLYRPKPHENIPGAK